MRIVARKILQLFIYLFAHFRPRGSAPALPERPVGRCPGRWSLPARHYRGFSWIQTPARTGFRPMLTPIIRGRCRMVPDSLATMIVFSSYVLCSGVRRVWYHPPRAWAGACRARPGRAEPPTARARDESRERINRIRFIEIRIIRQPCTIPGPSSGLMNCTRRPADLDFLKDVQDRVVDWSVSRVLWWVIAGMGSDPRTSNRPCTVGPPTISAIHNVLVMS